MKVNSGIKLTLLRDFTIDDLLYLNTLILIYTALFTAPHVTKSGNVFVYLKVFI